MNVTLHSEPYDYSITVPRQAILKFIPDSVLGRALSGDPSVDIINIPNKVVTPEVMDMLQNILVNGKLPSIYISPPSQEDYINSANYLGIDALGLLVDPNWPNFAKSYPSINFLNPSIIRSKTFYQRMMSYALYTPDPFMLTYILNTVPPYTFLDVDDEAVRFAILSKNQPLSEILIKRIPPPYNNVIDFQLRYL